MTPAFRSSVAIILDHEGGYVNNPKDPGGETNFGISKRQYPELDIKYLTREQAMEIYYRDYWKKIRGDKLPFGVALCLFDMAVNIGVKRSVGMLQAIVNSKQDGIFGDRTLEATLSLNSAHVIEQLAVERILYYTRLSTFSTFGNGWINRTIETTSTALLVRDMI